MSDVLSEIFGDAAASAPSQVKSFHKVNRKNKKELLDWFNLVFNSLVEQAEPRTRQQRENLMHYRGINIRRRDIDRDRAFRGRRLNKVNKLVVPILHDLTETRVSQMTRIKPDVEVLPTNNEWEDQASAKVVGFIIKHLWYINNLDAIIQQHHRHARIFGESYIWHDWDVNKGDLHPLFVEAKEAGIEKLEIPGGPTYTIDKPVYTGDIDYKLELPWRVFLQRKTQFCEVEYAFRVHLQPTDIVKDKYGEKSVKSTDDLRIFDIDNVSDRLLEDHTMVVEFWHKKTPELPEGFHAFFTKDALLETENHPYSFGGLPFHRLTDMDVPNHLNGHSKYELVMPMLNMYNNVNTLIAKNIWLTAHAKWMMPRGAAKIEQLGNDNTVVQYQGAVPPQLVQVQPNPPEVYRWKEDLKMDAERVYGNHGISRGEIPPGITAASALTFLNELESQRASTEISKHSDMIKSIAKMTVAIVGDKYDVDDGRLVRIVGEGNKYLIRQFNTAHLHKAYDIRLDIGTGLPDTKAGKRQIILDMMQRNPTGYPMERWEELLEVGNTEKAIDLMTYAIKSADSENEDFASGRPVHPVEIYEDHIGHLMSHYAFVQSRQFKEDMPPERSKSLLDHIFWTEEAALEKASRDPQYEAKLAALPLFPMFAHEAPQVRSRAQQEAVVQGIANKQGVAPEGYSIPGDEAELQNRKP